MKQFPSRREQATRSKPTTNCSSVELVSENNVPPDRRSSHPCPARPASRALASALRRPPRSCLRSAVVPWPPSPTRNVAQPPFSNTIALGGRNHDSVAIRATIFTAALHNPPSGLPKQPPARSVRWVAEACREGAPYDKAEGFVQGPERNDTLGTGLSRARAVHHRIRLRTASRHRPARPQLCAALDVRGPDWG